VCEDKQEKRERERNKIELVKEEEDTYTADWAGLLTDRFVPDAVVGEQQRSCITNRNKDHSVMNELSNGRQGSGFLASVL